MIKNKWFLGLFSSLILVACSQNEVEMMNKIQFLQEEAQAGYKVDVTDINWSQYADSLFVKFKIVTKENEKEIWGDLRHSEVELINEKAGLKDIRRLNRDKGNIPENILVSLLIDKSILAEDMERVQEAVRFFVNNLPENTAYISFFDNTISRSLPITPENFDSFEQDFNATKSDKIIFGATLNKYEELAGQAGSLSNMAMQLKIQNDTIKKYLVLLTDGKSTATGEEADNIMRFNEVIKQMDDDALNNNQIEIHAIRYGLGNPTVDKHLSFICKDIRKDNVKGEFYAAAPDRVLNRLTEVIDKISPDYELSLFNLPGRIFAGESRDLMIRVDKNAKKAAGMKNYSIGTLTNPVITGTTNQFQHILLGMLWGLIILFISYFTIQIIIPLLISKSSNFEKRYVREYQPNEDEIIKCNFCMDDLVGGEKVVEKCQHITHLQCWQENGYKCLEYGQNCKEGKQFFYDKEKPFSAANSPYYMKWLLSGLTGGLLSWIIYQYVVSGHPLLLKPFTEKFLSGFFPNYIYRVDADVLVGFLSKIGPLLLIGIVLGFILTFLFSYINEYRQKKGKIMLQIFIRSIIGAFFGFLSFLIGSLFIVSGKASSTNFLIDWIPWLLFGGSLGLCLSYKTDIIWKHALLGGILSGLISFVLLFLNPWFGSFATLLSFMLYSAGLGLSIVTIHRTAQKYFLKYRGAKDGEIAIHKWMSVLGGSNDVTIGRSNQCVVQMNWDTNPTIQDIHVKLYVDKKMKTPFLKSLANDLIYNGNQVRFNDEFQLKNGVTFRIGDTEFQYTEKI